MEKPLRLMLLLLVAICAGAQTQQTTTLPAPSIATDRPQGVQLINSRMSAGVHQVDAPVSGSPTTYGGCGMVPDSTTGLDGTDNYAAWLACLVQYPAGHFVLGAGMYRFSHDFILPATATLEGTQYCPNNTSPASTVLNCGSTIVVPGGVNGMHVQASATFHDFNIINAQDGHARIPSDLPTVVTMPAGANLSEFAFFGSSNGGNLTQFQRVNATSIVTATVSSTVQPELARDNVITVTGSGTFNGTFYVNSVTSGGSVWLVTWTQAGADETITAASIGSIQPATTGASNSNGIIFEGAGAHGYNMGVSNFAHACVTHAGGATISDDTVFSNSWLSGCAIGLNITPGADTSKGTYSHIEVFNNLINGLRARSFLGDTFYDFQASFNAGSFLPGGTAPVTLTGCTKVSGLETCAATAHGFKVGNAIFQYGTSVAGDNLTAPTSVTRCDVTAFIMTCNAVAHGLTVGAPVELDGGSNVNLNGIDTTIATVPDADHFTAVLFPGVQTIVNSTGGIVYEAKISGYIASVPDPNHFTMQLVNNTSSASSTGGTAQIAGGQVFMYAFAGGNAAEDIGQQNLAGHNIAFGFYTEGHRIHAIDGCDVRFNDSVLVDQPHFSGTQCGGDTTFADKDFGHRLVAAQFTVNANGFAFKPYANGNPTVASVVSWTSAGDITAHTVTCVTSPCGNGIVDPGANGIVKRTSLNVSAAAAFGDVVTMWASGGCTSGWLAWNGTCTSPTAATQRGADAVRDISLDSTGASDNSSALQTYINALSGTGTEIFFPCGTYKFTTGVHVTTSTSVSLRGAATTTFSGNSNSCVNFNIAGGVNGIWFDYSGPTTSNRGVHISHIQFTDTSASNIALSALRLTSNNYFYLEDLGFQNFQGQAYSTGTVAVTQGSATVTGTSTVWTTGMDQKGMLWINGYPQQIDSINTGTQVITLTEPYEGTTNATASYELDWGGMGFVCDGGTGNVSNFCQYGTLINLKSWKTRIPFMFIGGTSGATGTSRIKAYGGNTDCQRLANSIGAFFGGFSDTNHWDMTENSCTIGLAVERGHEHVISGNFEIAGTPFPANTTCAGSPSKACTKAILIRGWTSTNTRMNTVTGAEMAGYGNGVEIGLNASRTILIGNNYTGNTTDIVQPAAGNPGKDETLILEQTTTQFPNATIVRAQRFGSGVSSNTDLTGSVTLAAGTGTYSFTGTYTTAPNCTATDSTAANAVKASATTSTLTLTGTSTDVIKYICASLN